MLIISIFNPIRLLLFPFTNHVGDDRKNMWSDELVNVFEVMDM